MFPSLAPPPPPPQTTTSSTPAASSSAPSMAGAGAGTALRRSSSLTSVIDSTTTNTTTTATTTTITANSPSPTTTTTSPPSNNTATATTVSLLLKCSSAHSLSQSPLAAALSSLPLETTRIGGVKAAIHSLHPLHPLPTDIRLIYAGKLLSDDYATLAAILKNADRSISPTFHMVLKANSITSTNTTTIPQTQIAEIKQEPSSATATSTSILPRSAGAKSDSTSSIATSSTTSSLSSSSVASHHTSSSGGGGGGHGQYPSSSMPATSAANHEVVHQQYPVGYPASFGLLPYQVVVINGIPYAVTPTPHFMAQQQQQISVVSAGIAVSPPSLTQTSTTHQQPLPQVQHQQAAPAPAPVAVAAPLPAPAPAQPAPQPIAGGAAADPIMNDEFDDAVRNAPPNPWWLLFKLSFLVYIFSQNASTMRVVVLYVSALVIFLVQTRWLVGVVRWPIRRVRGGNGRQGGVVVPAPVPLPAADAANVRAAPGVGDQQLQQMDPNNDNATPQVTLAPQQPQPPSFLQNIQSLLWTFISTLIPENQQDN